MKTYLKFSLLLLLLAVNISLKAQTDATNLKSFAKNFETFFKNYPQEKVYLHFDNTEYFIGETIWFKAYIVSVEQNDLSALSGVLYVELVTTEGNVVETKKLKILDGMCHGEFKLPTTNYAGFYEVRAYTRYMLNFGKDNCFSRVFPVYDMPKEEGNFQHKISERATSNRIHRIRPEYSQQESVDIKFFPEGGHLIEGLISNVAFKATGIYGENAIVSGIIYNEQGDSITEFSTNFQGMGNFQFTPIKNSYKAKIYYKNRSYIINLPKVEPVGYNININTLYDNKIDIQVQKNEITPADTLGLIVTCRGKIYASDYISFAKGNIDIMTLSKDKLPSGVIQILLFNTLGKLFSERLAFINHHNHLKINITQDKVQYKPFEKINLDFQLYDPQNNPVETIFSVSVRDAATTPSNSICNNILTNLLLSSDLKGYIQNPQFYFESDDLSHRMALDLLMQVQGWSRYQWSQTVDTKNFKLQYPIEEKMAIEGTVVSLVRNNKLENIDINMLLLADTTSQKSRSVTDINGKFKFELADFYGQANVLLNTKKKNKAKEYKILLERNFNPGLKMYSVYEQLETDPNIFLTHINRLKERPLNSIQIIHDSLNSLPIDKKNKFLKEVIVKAKKKRNNLSNYKINIKYDVAKAMDNIKDLGNWEPASFIQLLSTLNTYFSYTPDEYGRFQCLYKARPVKFGYTTANQGTSLLESSNKHSNNNFETEATNNDDSKENSLLANNENSNKRDQDLSISLSQTPALNEIESILIIEDMNTILKFDPTFDPIKGGALILLTHNKNNSKETEAYGTRKTYYEGYTNVKEFYSPQYDKIMLPDEKDYRRTLYWNPDVKTNTDGKVRLSFYNNDSCKVIDISAETVTEDGLIGIANKLPH